VKIGMLMTPHSTKRNSPLMTEVLALLQQWNVKVDVVHPDDSVTPLASLRAEHDLYVLKAQSELTHSIAGALHAMGAPILNPWPVAVMMKDKVAAMRRLIAAGVPIPETYITSSAHRLATLLEDGPLVIRPSRASKGHGARIVWDADEVEDAVLGGGPLLVQRYHKPDGPDEADRKIYCIGGQLFGVLRKLPAHTFREKCGEPFIITKELRDIAVRCADAFGVELFGLDLILRNGDPYVVDIHAFPGFKGVPDAALRLADYIYATGRLAMAGQMIGGRDDDLAAPVAKARSA
jgi:ribosomal protein S6--L-glutamate ligase